MLEKSANIPFLDEFVEIIEVMLAIIYFKFKGSLLVITNITLGFL